MRKTITAAQAVMAGLAFMVAVLVAGPLAQAQDLVWNTFLGSAATDDGRGIAVDASGNVYVTGHSDATWGSPVRAHAGGYEAYVAKFDSSGNLVWNTFLGSAANDYGTGIAVDASGNVYVTGQSDTTWGSPVRAFAGDAEAFVAKLNASGNLVWNTFLGSASRDYGHGIAVDASGNVYVTGTSNATWGSPIRAFAGEDDAFVAKLNSSGNLVWNTFLGSADYDYGRDIAVDASGNVYVTGNSEATWGSPIRAFAGDEDAFVAKLNSSGNLVWNTFLGSVAYDNGNGIAVDASGNVYVTGGSGATWGSPIRAFAGDAEAFVAKLNASGNLVWNTFLGSAEEEDSGLGIAVDASGNVYVTGYSFVTWGSPVRAFAGNGEAYVAKLNSSGTLVWNTFLGSAGGDDLSLGIAVDASGNVYVTGYSFVTWGSPVRAHAGGVDAFVAKLSQPCEGDADCTDKMFCNGLEQCVARECVPGEPPLCPGDAPVCDEENDSCVECLDDLYCADGEVCELGVCVEEVACGLIINPAVLNIDKKGKQAKQMFTIKGIKGEAGFDPNGDIVFGPFMFDSSVVGKDVLKVSILVPGNAVPTGDSFDVTVGSCTGQVSIKRK